MTKTHFKYNEDKILKELFEYVATTYKSHYVGDDNVQAMDLIMSSGHGVGFTIGDIIKYAARYGKKKGQERIDILKILHYAMFLLYIHDKTEERRANPVSPTSQPEIGKDPISQLEDEYKKPHVNKG